MSLKKDIERYVGESMPLTMTFTDEKGAIITDISGMTFSLDISDGTHTPSGTKAEGKCEADFAIPAAVYGTAGEHPYKLWYTNASGTGMSQYGTLIYK